MKKLILLLFLCLFYRVNAQSIKGLVQDEGGNPIIAATITITSAADTLNHQTFTTNDVGRFSFSIQTGNYILCATGVGYAKSCSTPLNLVSSNDQEVNLVLGRNLTSMDEVTVVSQKPLIEMRADKMIINVEGTINSVGTTALEVLRKAPGVAIDNEDNISLTGKNGVQVYIDGRLSPLSGSDLASYLSSLQSAQLESIEIITNPSARYEAAGNGGIINIRMKKNKTFGTNGSINAGFGTGRYSKYNGGFSINHRNKRVNIFGSYNYADGRTFIRTNTYRMLADSIFNQYATRVFTDKPHNIQAGLDYFVNKNTTVGLLINILPGQQVFDNRSRSTIQHEDSGSIERQLVALGLGKNKRRNTNVNLNYRMSTPTSDLDMDADYAHYSLVSDQYQPNYYYDNQDDFIYSRIYHMLSPSDIKMHSLKLNYDFNAGKGKLSIGGKYGQVRSDNNFERFNVVNAVEMADSLRTNNFLYKENINAVYGRYSLDVDKFLFQFGVRAENTNISGYSNGYKSNGYYQPYDSVFKRNYTDLFPSASITYRRNMDNQFSLNLGRRIDRPPYQDLNPFEFKIDEYISRKGNTNLQPQYTNSVELIHIYKDKLTTSLGYSHVNDVFTQIFDTAETSKTFITKTNVATQDVVNLFINYSFQWKRYSGYFNLNPFYNHYRSNFGAGRDLDLEAFAYIIKSQHGYKFKHGFAAELSFLYNSPGIGLGFFRGKGLGNVDIAVAKSLFNNKVSVKAAMSDVFFTNKISATSSFAGQEMEVYRTFEPRLFRINISYKFGSSMIKASRQRRTLMDEENKRLQSGN